MVAWPASRPALLGGQVGWGPGGPTMYLNQTGDLLDIVATDVLSPRAPSPSPGPAPRAPLAPIQPGPPPKLACWLARPPCMWAAHHVWLPHHVFGLPTVRVWVCMSDFKGIISFRICFLKTTCVFGQTLYDAVCTVC